jgi:hypothetical protein
MDRVPLGGIPEHLFQEIMAASVKALQEGPAEVKERIQKAIASGVEPDVFLEGGFAVVEIADWRYEHPLEYRPPKGHRTLN